MDNIATTKKTRETSEITKNIVLEGVEMLKVEKLTTVYEVIKEIKPGIVGNLTRVIEKEKIDEKREVLDFPLIETSPETVAEYRKNGIPSFVLKVNGKLYYSEIPDNINFMSHNLLGHHKCAISGHECNRLSAASDEKGGCEKVRNRSNFIERYPWITTGYETFNTKHNAFLVVECLHYESCPPRKRPTAAEINAARLGLAQFVWPDVTTLGEVKARVAKNRRRGEMNRY